MQVTAFKKGKRKCAQQLIIITYEMQQLKIY